VVKTKITHFGLNSEMSAALSFYLSKSFIGQQYIQKAFKRFMRPFCKGEICKTYGWKLAHIRKTLYLIL